MPMSRHSVGDLSGNKLTRKLSGNIRPQSSRLAEPVWTDPGIKSENSARELISTLKKKNSAGGKWRVDHSPQTLTNEKKATTMLANFVRTAMTGWVEGRVQSRSGSVCLFFLKLVFNSSIN